MQHYRPTRFNEFLKEGTVFTQKDDGWYNGNYRYVSSSNELLDMALEKGYLKLIPENPVDEPIKIGDKVVWGNAYFIVARINPKDGEIYDICSDCWSVESVRHCTPDEIAKYFR